jgi:hypothetical protein
MSDPASSEPLRGPNATARVAPRVPVAAVLAVCLNPLLGLANQGVLYVTTTWMCAGGHRWFALAVPVVSLVLVAVLIARAYHSRQQRAYAGSTAPGRFLASVGMALGVIAAILIIAQWAAAFTFPPCGAG